MVSYLAALWPTDQDVDPRAQAELDQLVGGQTGWRWVCRDSHVRVAVAAPGRPPVRRTPWGVVLGEVWAQAPLGRQAQLEAAQELDPESRARRLCHDVFGRYVALMGGRCEVAAFRDPSGGLDVIAWPWAGGVLVSDDLPAWLDPLAPPDLSLDLDRLALMAANSSAFGGALGLRGVTTVAAGELVQWRAKRQDRRQLWSPGGIVRLALGRVRPRAERLRELVEGCVAAYAGADGAILAELSGGLDSAIVGQALARTGRVAAWLNYHVVDPQGDERPYARAVATHLGVSLTEVAHPDTALTLDQLRGLSGGARPGLNGLDVQHDQDLAARARALGASRLITGQGGDTVFFQMATPLILADHLQARGLAALASPVALNLARWTRRSVWSVWRAALAVQLGRRPPPAVPAPAWLTPQARAAAAQGLVHPWLADLGCVPPAKRRQIQGLVHGQLFWAPSARGAAADLLHPLLSQPVMEYGLALGADVLTGGGVRDRAFARHAFADRLPEVTVTRRGKGHLSAYYSRLVAASLPQLRPWLLEGRLVALGIVDPEALAGAMTPEALCWHGRCGELMDLACLEAWVEAWTERCDQRSSFKMAQPGA